MIQVISEATCATRLKAKREELKLSLQACGDRIGVSNTTIMRWEAGGCDLGVAKLAAEFGLTPNEIFLEVLPERLPAPGDALEGFAGADVELLRETLDKLRELTVAALENKSEESPAHILRDHVVKVHRMVFGAAEALPIGTELTKETVENMEVRGYTAPSGKVAKSMRATRVSDPEPKYKVGEKKTPYGRPKGRQRHKSG